MSQFCSIFHKNECTPVPGLIRRTEEWCRSAPTSRALFQRFVATGRSGERWDNGLEPMAPPRRIFLTVLNILIRCQSPVVSTAALGVIALR